MNFSNEKNGYNIAEVNAYIKSLQSASEQKSERIEELKVQVSKLSAQLDAEKSKRDLINKAIYSAVAKADRIEALSRRKYEQDMSQLKAFHEEWTSYYNKIMQKYPMDDELMEVVVFNRRMNDLLTGKEEKSLQEYLEQEKSRVEKAEIVVEGKSKSNKTLWDFDPVERIKAFLSSKDMRWSEQNTESDKVEEYEGEGAFSFEEALNPTDDLSTIMRDLGFDVED